MIMEQSDKLKCLVMASFGMVICISRFIENVNMSLGRVINSQNLFTFSYTICTLQLIWSAFGVCFINMLFRGQAEFIQRLRVLIIGQLFTLISDITFFVIVKQAAATTSMPATTYSFDFFAFLLGLEICYFVLMFELSLHSESLMRDQQQQHQHSRLAHSTISLPTYDEAVHMIELGK